MAFRQQRVDALLPASARRRAGIVLAGCAFVTAVGGYVCSRGRYGDPLDGPIDAWIIAHLGEYGRALQLAVDIGQPAQVAVLTTILILACLTARRINGAILAALSVPIAGVLTEKVLKPLVHESYSAYPSGRATGAFALIAIVAVLLARPARSTLQSGWRLSVVAASLLVGCAVCVAAVGLNDHHFTDTVGGAAVGTGVVLTATFLLDLSVVRNKLAVAYPACADLRHKRAAEGGARADSSLGRLDGR